MVAIALATVAGTPGLRRYPAASTSSGNPSPASDQMTPGNAAWHRLTIEGIDQVLVALIHNRAHFCNFCTSRYSLSLAKL
jgi:hypothetical protein